MSTRNSKSESHDHPPDAAASGAEASGVAKPNVATPGVPKPSVAAPGVSRNVTGRVKHDDRGNAVWEWAVTTGSFGADVANQRLKKLEAADLALADERPKNPKSFSPYDNALPEKKEQTRRTDLRKLSEWMKLRRQAAANKDED